MNVLHRQKLKSQRPSSERFVYTFFLFSTLMISSFSPSFGSGSPSNVVTTLVVVVVTVLTSSITSGGGSHGVKGLSFAANGFLTFDTAIG